MKQIFPLFLIFLVTLITSATFSKAGNSEPSRTSCSCIFNGRKDYQVFDEKKTFFGRKVYRKWTCEYDCVSGNSSEKVIGSYEMTNHGDDNGLEGICEGTEYESQFSQYLMRDVYVYKSTHGFSPNKGKAIELKKWAEAQGCE